MNENPTTVLLAGATGLVGSHCLTKLLALPQVERVIPIVRRPLAANDPRVTPVVLDFAALGSLPVEKARVALCALGTTIKQAGSKPGFRAVDFEAVLSFAHYAARCGATVFGLVSSIGAAEDSRNFYLKVKGEAEAAVAGQGFRVFAALRPSLLLGTRTQTRPGEAVSQLFYPLFSPLLQGSTRRFRAIPAERVAAALVSLAFQPPTAGRTVWFYDDILCAASKWESRQKP